MAFMEQVLLLMCSCVVLQIMFYYINYIAGSVDVVKVLGDAKLFINS